MAKYRKSLPMLGDRLFLTDGGLETTLIFHEGLELPEFASFHLLRDKAGERHLRRYFERYIQIAEEAGTGFVLESVTWRSSRDWGERLGYSEAALTDANRRAMAMLDEIRAAHEHRTGTMVISGCIGPRGDGYVASAKMSADQARDYHAWQAGILADSQADLISAMTMNYVEEALGITRAAQAVEMPVVLSFTVETDGHLPTGQPLGEAIDQVDQETGGYPSYYMVNCAHPEHFAHVLAGGGAWVERVRGLRANASRRSHAELNESPDLDAGNPEELGAQHAELKARLAHLCVLGGCCGTDHRHVEEIARACAPLHGGQ